MLFDTHVHLDGFAAEGSLAEVLRAAGEAGVGRMCAVGNDAANNAFVLQLAEAHPGDILAAVGFDRDQAGRELPLDELAAQLRDPRVVATGEIGLDYFYSPDSAQAQRTLFSRMLTMAVDAGKPVVVHSRDADEDTLAMLREFAAEWRAKFHMPPGILHCFTRGAAMADALMEMGFLISFSGIVTFLNADPLRRIAQGIPAEYLLIETDCPYLTPAPHRGQRNEPRFLEFVARRIAELRGVSLEEIARLTTSNAERIFQSPPKPKEAAS